MNHPPRTTRDAPGHASTVEPCAVAVIIVSYNTRPITLECLSHLEPALAELQAQTIVVDNDSHDGSAEAIAQRFPRVQLIASDRNLGFGAANNLAMERAAGRYLLLLNSDAFVAPGAIDVLIQYLDEHPRVGVVGPRLLNRDGTLQRSCFRYPTPGRAWLENLGVSRVAPPRSRLGDYRRWPHDQAGEVDWAIGACLLVRRQVVEQVGGFDPSFFMYAEETDWQKRIRDAGWAIHFTPQAQVTHLGGASGASDRARVNRLFFEGIDRYQLKHYGPAGLLAFRLAVAVGGLGRLPVWTLAYLVRPGARAKAAQRIRLYGWLIYRQLFCWPRRQRV